MRFDIIALNYMLDLRFIDPLVSGQKIWEKIKTAFFNATLHFLR